MPITIHSLLSPIAQSLNRPIAQSTTHTCIPTNTPSRLPALHPLHILSVVHMLLSIPSSIVHLRPIPRIQMPIAHSRIHSFRPSIPLIIRVMRHSVAHLPSVIHRPRYVPFPSLAYNSPSPRDPFQASASRSSDSSFAPSPDAADNPEAAARIAPAAAAASSAAPAADPTPPSSAASSAGRQAASD